MAGVCGEIKIRFEFMRIRLNLKCRGGEAGTAPCLPLGLHNLSSRAVYYGNAQTFWKLAVNRSVNNVSCRL